MNAAWGWPICIPLFGNSAVRAMRRCSSADGGVVLPVLPQPQIMIDEPVCVSLRPHDVRLSNGRDSGKPAPEGYYSFPGTVRECFYFGEVLDYQVGIGDSQTLRVIASPSDRYAPGETVNVLVHPENCVVIRTG